MTSRSCFALGVFAISLAAPPLSAQELRRLNPIPRPAAAGTGSGPAAAFRPVDELAVERALERIVDAWNTPSLRGILGDRFYDASRLADVVATTPRDARLRLLAIEAVRTISQKVEPGPPGSGTITVRSLVSVVARTQVEFEDPQAGFSRFEGTNEYVFRLTERAER